MRKAQPPRPRAIKQKISITLDAEMVQCVDRRSLNRSDEINRVLRKHYEAKVATK